EPFTSLRLETFGRARDLRFGSVLLGAAGVTLARIGRDRRLRARQEHHYEDREETPHRVSISGRRLRAHHGTPEGARATPSRRQRFPSRWPWPMSRPQRARPWRGLLSCKPRDQPRLTSPGGD